MIQIFYGNDRVSAEKEAKTLLGKNCEIIDGESLEKYELSPIFMGNSLFADTRNILIKGLTNHKENFDELEKYLDTKHNIILLENSLNGTWSSVKNLKKEPKITLKEFKLPEKKEDFFVSFKIYDLALTDSKKAYNLLKQHEPTEDPYMMLGSFASNAIKKYSASKTEKNKRILKELANLDRLMKNSKFSQDPWLLIETFVLRLKSL